MDGATPRDDREAKAEPQVIRGWNVGGAKARGRRAPRQADHQGPQRRHSRQRREQAAGAPPHRTVRRLRSLDRHPRPGDLRADAHVHGDRSERAAGRHRRHQQPSRSSAPPGFTAISFHRADRLRRVGAASAAAQGALPHRRAGVVLQLRDLLHPGLPGHHRRHGPLLDLFRSRALGRQGGEPDDHRRPHVLARDGVASGHRLHGAGGRAYRTSIICRRCSTASSALGIVAALVRLSVLGLEGPQGQDPGLYARAAGPLAHARPDLPRPDRPLRRGRDALRPDGSRRARSTI